MRRSLVIGSKLLEYMARAPKKAEASWRTLAQKLKAAPDLTSLEGKHIDKIKKQGVYSVEDSVGKLEEELQEEMAQALGRTGDKLEYVFKLMKLAQKSYYKSIENSEELIKRQLAAETFNTLREEVDTRRRDLIIQRQAVGFYWRNHQIITDHYPIPNKIRVPTE
jgi:hypothetical protein